MQKEHVTENRNAYEAALTAWRAIEKRAADVRGNPASLETRLDGLKAERKSLLQEQAAGEELDTELAANKAAIAEAQSNLEDSRVTADALKESQLQAADELRAAHGALENAIKAEAHARYEAALTRLKEVAGPLIAECLGLYRPIAGYAYFTEAKDIVDRAKLNHVHAGETPAELLSPRLPHGLPERPVKATPPTKPFATSRGNYIDAAARAMNEQADRKRDASYGVPR